jgi:hypothetical protein
MKSIPQIFQNNRGLMDEPEVQELIEYCQELEGQVMDTKQSEQFSFEDKLTILVREIYGGIKDVQREQMEHDRWDFDTPDYKQCVENLDRYLREFSRNNKFNLHE